MIRSLLGMLFLALACTGSVQKASAQSLNWEGENGIFVTPLAYTVLGKQNGFDLPAVSYHLVDEGPVLGDFHQVSITEGAYDRFEFSYTRNFYQDGSTAGLSNLWGNSFNIFHGEVGVLKEGRRIHPAISVGHERRVRISHTPSGSFAIADGKDYEGGSKRFACHTMRSAEMTSSGG